MIVTNGDLCFSCLYNSFLSLSLPVKVIIIGSIIFVSMMFGWLFYQVIFNREMEVRR